MNAVRRAVLDHAAVTALRGWAGETGAWPAGSHVWGQYAERTPAGDAICRTENVTACHPGIASLVDGELRALADGWLRTASAAFKDKLNYKQPGGAGFGPHQDVLAYPGARRVVSILLAVDECSIDSGCLWVADGGGQVLPTDARGVIVADVAAALDWAPAELAPGDAVCIDGLAPHRSDANHTSHPRRVLVASYAPASERYGRDDYYAARRSAMHEATAADGRFRISTLADFEGTEVAVEAPAGTECTHARWSA